MSRFVYTAAIGVSLALVPQSARADSATADALFTVAKQLMDEGRIAEACEKFEASYEADKTLGTLLNIANCHEKAGSIATAWARWGEGVEMARKAGDDRAEYAADRREALEPELPKLIVRVTGAAPDLTVARMDSRGRTVLEPATFGVALPVDPGDHIVRVERDTEVLFEQRFTAEKQSQSEVSIDLDKISKENAVIEPSATPVAQQSTQPMDEASDTQLILGWVVTGVGAAGLVTAGVFGGLALSSKSDADAGCVGTEEKFCTQDGLDAGDTAEGHADAMQWIGIAAIVVTSVGVTLVLTAPDESALEMRADAEPAPTVALTPLATPQGGGVFVHGTF